MTMPAAILEKEIVRAIRAARKCGLKLVRIQKGDFVITLPLDDDTVKTLTTRLQQPAERAPIILW
jgi:hypothetical protein